MTPMRSPLIKTVALAFSRAKPCYGLSEIKYLGFAHKNTF
jgi:hypothetical protein